MNVEPELTAVNLKYLQAIYEISRKEQVVSSAAIARKLGVTKPSVAKMLESLAAKKLLTKKHYGKVCLTAMGLHIAMDFETRIQTFVKLLPRLGLHLQETELYSALVRWLVLCRRIFCSVKNTTGFRDNPKLRF